MHAIVYVLYRMPMYVYMFFSFSSPCEFKICYIILYYTTLPLPIYMCV